MKISRRIINLAVGIGSFVLIWEIICLVLRNPFLPTPFEVMLSLVALFEGPIYVHILASLKRTFMGFMFALIIGSILGYIIGSSKRLKDYFTPVIELIRPIPPIAWIPLAILWFGVGDFSSSFIIFIAAFFPIFTNVYFGVTSIPKVYHRLSKNCKVEKLNKFIHVVFPFSLPYLITGCKTSVGFSWMAVIAAEMIAADHGLGYFIELNRVLVRPELVIATMAIIGVIGFLIHGFVILLEKEYTSWRTK